MKSERLLRAGWDLVAVLATAAHFAVRGGFPSLQGRRTGANVVGSRDGAGPGAAQAEPQHDRFRPRPGYGRTARTLRDAARSRARRALRRRARAVSPLRPDLAH